jgi:osmotically-inducible protein OsmY
MGPMPSIHIIVKNGRVTLEGFVLNEQDIKIASMAVREVPGLFSLTNNLKIEK